MRTQGQGAKGGGKSRKVNWQHVPQDSISNADPTFFLTTNLNDKPSSSSSTPHGQSKTWKSQEAKERDHFSRINNLVHHFVPDSPFPPKNYSAWVEHRAGINEEQKAALLKNIAVMRIRKTAAARVSLTSAFANVGIKPLKDNRSTALSLPSIWANNYTPTPSRPEAPWPERSEMQHEGGDRAGGDGGKTNFQRYLPLCRRPGNETVNWKAREVLEPLSMIDETETPPWMKRENREVNKEMDEDCNFWKQGLHYVGTNLMKELKRAKNEWE